MTSYYQKNEKCAKKAPKQPAKGFIGYLGDSTPNIYLQRKIRCRKSNHSQKKLKKSGKNGGPFIVKIFRAMGEHQTQNIEKIFFVFFRISPIFARISYGFQSKNTNSSNIIIYKFIKQKHNIYRHTLENSRYIKVQFVEKNEIQVKK